MEQMVITKEISNEEKETKMQTARKYIEKNIRFRQANKVLFAHPSPMYWNMTEIPVNHLIAEREQLRNEKKIDKNTNLYISTPFCLKTTPSRCGYCLFPAVDFTGYKEVEKYLGYLEKEARMYHELIEDDCSLASVYFGGGTANILKDEDYARLVGVVGKIFKKIPSDIEMTLEGIPSLFNKKKLQAIKECGINRISMGVQQLNDDLVKYSGRNQNKKHTMDILEWCRELELEISIDLIFGWPDQTEATMLEDLKILVDFGVKHITHYELNIAGKHCPSHFAQNMKDRIPSINETLDMYSVSRDFLLQNGYQQVTSYDFTKTSEGSLENFDYERNVRNALTWSSEKGITGSDSLGIGFGAMNCIAGTFENPGSIFVNQIDLDNYYKSLDNQQLPIFRGYLYEDIDIKIAALFHMIQSLRIDINVCSKIFNSNILDDFDYIWDVLLEMKWIEISDDKILFIGDGGFYIPLIQGLLANERKKELQPIF